MAVLNRRNAQATESLVKGARTMHAIRWSKNNDPLGIVKLARERSKAAILKLEALMNGKAGTIKVLDPRNGGLIEVEIEVPAAVQAKCAEIIIERAYGKSPQAILIQEDTPESRRILSTAEKIAAIQAAREGREQTTDLEASEITEVKALPAPAGDAIEVPASPVNGYNPEDLV